MGKGRLAPTQLIKLIMDKTFRDYYKFPLRVDTIIPFKTWCAGEGMNMAYDVTRWNLVPHLYQELVDIINGDMEVTASAEWSKPHKYIAVGSEIFAEGSTKPIIIVRGWGKLIGNGGYKLNQNDATEIQDGFINYILERLNKKQ